MKKKSKMDLDMDPRTRRKKRITKLMTRISSTTTSSSSPLCLTNTSSSTKEISLISTATLSPKTTIIMNHYLNSGLNNNHNINDNFITSSSKTSKLSSLYHNNNNHYDRHLNRHPLLRRTSSSTRHNSFMMKMIIMMTTFLILLLSPSSTTLFDCCFCFVVQSSSSDSLMVDNGARLSSHSSTILTTTSGFEAAFQGECRKSSPCQQLCFDLHDGTFECACNDGYHLDINGYSCIRHEPASQQAPTPPNNKNNIIKSSSATSLLKSSKFNTNNKNNNNNIKFKIQKKIKNKNTNNNSNSKAIQMKHQHFTVSSSVSKNLTIIPQLPVFDLIEQFQTYSTDATPTTSTLPQAPPLPYSSNVDFSPTSSSSSSSTLYSCNDIECEAGGVCIEPPPTRVSNQARPESQSYQQRVRCKCPLGRGGQFCEKIIEVKQPRFMGSSYLALPTLRNAHRSLKINVQFKPESFDGVLLYSGQETNLDGDFIAIILNQGFVEFWFDCGMGEGVIRSDMPIRLDSWNTLDIYRDGRNAWMQLNQAQQIFGHSKGLFSRITFRLETFLGGSPNISQIRQRIPVNNGLIGCIRVLKINDRNYDLYNDTIDGIDIDQCSQDACKDVTCLNGGHCTASRLMLQANDDESDNQIQQHQTQQQLCICPLGFQGEFCEQQIEEQYSIPSFNGTSYLQFTGIGEYSRTMFTEIFIVIKPNEPNGLFLYNGQRMDQTGDFISLNLVDGYVEFRFDLGSGAAILRSSEKLTLKEWHTIYATRTGRLGYLKVDDQAPSQGESLGAFTQLSLPLNLYIGGVPSLHRGIHHNVRATRLYRGCIQRLIINGHHYSLLDDDDVLSGVNIDNCQHSCSNTAISSAIGDVDSFRQPCQNNGVCVAFNHHYRCHCINDAISAISSSNRRSHYYYIGQHCEQETGFESSYPMFYGNSFLKFTDENIIQRIIGFKTIIHLNLRAFSSSGLILWLGGAGVSDSTGNIIAVDRRLQKTKLSFNSDYFTIGLNDGHVNVEVNLGDGGQPSRFQVNSTRLDDGQWHQLDVVRVGRQMLIRVDHLNSATVRGVIDGAHNQLNVQSALYLGGLEDTAMITNDHYDKGFIGCISNMTLNQNYQVDLMADSDRGINIRTCI